MLKFSKAYEVRELMRRSVKNGNLISAFFEDCPEIQEIVFEYSSEYDDNNYSDQARLVSVNGHQVDYSLEYDEADDGKDNPLSRPDSSVLESCYELVSTVASDFGYEEHVLTRSDYPPVESKGKGDLTKEESEYLHSYLTGETLRPQWFFKKDAKWACYYALDHGRFNEEAEFKIFARNNQMRWAYWYAFHVIKGRLPEEIEAFFMLSEPKKDDKHWLKKYMEFRAVPVTA